MVESATLRVYSPYSEWIREFEIILYASKMTKWTILINYENWLMNQL